MSRDVLPDSNMSFQVETSKFLKNNIILEQEKQSAIFYLPERTHNLNGFFLEQARRQI